MRKIILIIVILVILATIGWVGYLLFEKWTERNPSTRSSTEARSKSSPRAGSGQASLRQDQSRQGKLEAEMANSAKPQLKQITDFPIVNYWINKASGDIFIINYGGKITKISENNKTVASDNGLKNISQFSASPDGVKALINLTIFNTTNNTWTPLPAGAVAAAWSPDSSQIIYSKNDGLYLFNLKTNKSSLFLKLNNQELQLNWPTANEIYLSDKPSANIADDAWLVNVKNKTIAKLNEGARPNNLDLMGKCVTSETKKYCAAPKSIALESVLPDDYLKRKIYTSDDFYLEDKLLFAGSKTNPIDAINLSFQDNKLFFMNRYDQKLYSLKLVD